MNNIMQFSTRSFFGLIFLKQNKNKQKTLSIFSCLSLRNIAKYFYIWLFVILDILYSIFTEHFAWQYEYVIFNIFHPFVVYSTYHIFWLQNLVNVCMINKQFSPLKLMTDYDSGWIRPLWFNLGHENGPQLDNN